MKSNKNLYFVESKNRKIFILSENSAKAEKLFNKIIKSEYSDLYNNSSNRGKDKLNKFIKNNCGVIRISKVN